MSRFIFCDCNFNASFSVDGRAFMELHRNDDTQMTTSGKKKLFLLLSRIFPFFPSASVYINIRYEKNCSVRLSRQILYNHKLFIFIRRDDFCVFDRCRCSSSVVKMSTRCGCVVKVPPLRLIYGRTFGLENSGSAHCNV